MPLGSAPIVVAIAVVPTLLAYSALVGLGVARTGTPAAVALSATALVFLPAAAAMVGAATDRLLHAATTQLVWSAVLLVCLPVYFPGERREAVATGLALMLMEGPDDDDVARSIADQLPGEPELAQAQVPLVEPQTAPPMPPPAAALRDHQIALPYDGEGRRLSVPVVFDHGADSIETYMMLDTGATYTTLSRAQLRLLGALPGPDAPSLTLSTANGQRRAEVVLLDRVWLGDLAIENVAITTCEDCAAEDHAGLLGLNVTGGYNLTIDADRREVIFTSRERFDRRLDVSPFSELDGRFTRYPGGRVDFTLLFRNQSPHTISSAIARVDCGDESWRVTIGSVPAQEELEVSRRLPRHDPCPSYKIELAEADW